MKSNKTVRTTCSLYSIFGLLCMLISCQHNEHDISNMKKSRYAGGEGRRDLSLQTIEFGQRGKKQGDNEREEQGIENQKEEKISCCTKLFLKCCSCIIYRPQDEEDDESVAWEDHENLGLLVGTEEDPFATRIYTLGQEASSGNEYYTEINGTFTRFEVNPINSNPFAEEFGFWEMTYSTTLIPHPSHIQRIYCIPRESWGRSPYYPDRELVITNRLLYIPIHSGLTLDELASNSEFQPETKPLRNIFDPNNSEDMPEGKIIRLEDINPQPKVESPKFLDGPLDWLKSKFGIVEEKNQERILERSNVDNRPLDKSKIRFTFDRASGLTKTNIDNFISQDKVPYWISYTKNHLPKGSSLIGSDTYPTILEAMFILAYNPQMNYPILTSAEISTQTAVASIAISFNKKEKEFNFTTVNPLNPRNIHLIAVTRINKNPTGPGCCNYCEMPRFCCGQGCVRLNKCYFCSLPATFKCGNITFKGCKCGVPNCVCCICCCCCPTISGCCIYPTSTTYCERFSCSIKELCFCCKS